MEVLSTTDRYTGSSSVIKTYHVIWTNLGPLWATFTPPPSCKTEILGTGAIVSKTIETGFLGSSYPARDTKVACDTSVSSSPFYSHRGRGCIPHGRLSIDDSFAYFYSPGIACPVAWRTAGLFTLPHNVTTAPVGTSTPFWARSLLKTGGTHVICCPRLYPSNSFPMFT